MVIIGQKLGVITILAVRGRCGILEHLIEIFILHDYTELNCVLIADVVLLVAEGQLLVGDDEVALGLEDPLCQRGIGVGGTEDAAGFVFEQGEHFFEGDRFEKIAIDLFQHGAEGPIDGQSRMGHSFGHL